MHQVGTSSLLISTSLKQLMAYADDILILARTKKSLMEALQQLKKSSIEV